MKIVLKIYDLLDFVRTYSFIFVSASLSPIENIRKTLRFSLLEYFHIEISIKMSDIKTSNLIILLLDNGCNLIAYPKS